MQRSRTFDRLDEAVSFRGALVANGYARAEGRTVRSHHVLDVEEMPDWIDCAYQVDVDTGDITALILGTGLRWVS